MAVFYRPEDVPDPNKTNSLNPRYQILRDKVSAFVEAVVEIAEVIRGAVEEAASL